MAGNLPLNVTPQLQMATSAARVIQAQSVSSSIDQLMVVQCHTKSVCGAAAMVLLTVTTGMAKLTNWVTKRTQTTADGQAAILEVATMMRRR